MTRTQEKVHAADESAKEVYMFDLLAEVWRGRWLVLGVAFACAVAAAAIVVALPSWYRAQVVLIPAAEQKAFNLSGALAGIAGLAGVSVGGGDATEAIAVLKSLEFTGSFIEEQRLLPVLFARRWDARTETWKSADPEQQPDVRDAIRFFDRKVRRVTEDRRTKLVTLSIEWKDPVLAARWAESLVAGLNERMRARALAEAETNVSYLQEALASAGPVELRRSIGRLLEVEMQKLMLARGNKEFAFRFVDHAQVPKRRSWPNRILSVLVAAALGGTLASLFVLNRAGRRPVRAAS